MTPAGTAGRIAGDAVQAGMAPEVAGDAWQHWTDEDFTAEEDYLSAYASVE